MDGQDVKEGGVYKKKMVFREKGFIYKYPKEKKKKETGITLRKESEQCNFLYNIGLLEQACREIFAHLFDNINHFFLIFILGQSPFLQILLILAKVELYNSLF